MFSLLNYGQSGTIRARSRRCCCYVFRLSRSECFRLFPLSAMSDSFLSAFGSCVSGLRCSLRSCTLCALSPLPCRCCRVGDLRSDLRSDLVRPFCVLVFRSRSALLSALLYALALSCLVIADFRRIIALPRLFPRPRSVVACCAYYSVTRWAAARH